MRMICSAGYDTELSPGFLVKCLMEGSTNNQYLRYVIGFTSCFYNLHQWDVYYQECWNLILKPWITSEVSICGQHQQPVSQVRHSFYLESDTEARAYQ